VRRCGHAPKGGKLMLHRHPRAIPEQADRSRWAFHVAKPNAPRKLRRAFAFRGSGCSGGKALCFWRPQSAYDGS
jgi:hypothetical protein